MMITGAGAAFQMEDGQLPFATCWLNINTNTCLRRFCPALKLLPVRCSEKLCSALHCALHNAFSQVGGLHGRLACPCA